MSDNCHSTLEERTAQIVEALMAEVDKNCPGLDCAIRNQIYTSALDHCYRAVQDLEPVKNLDLAAVAKPATASLRAVFFNVSGAVQDIGIEFQGAGKITNQHAITAVPGSAAGLRAAEVLGSEGGLYGETLAVTTGFNYEPKQYGSAKVQGI